jgi:hypothetical protein
MIMTCLHTRNINMVDDVNVYSAEGNSLFTTGEVVEELISWAILRTTRQQFPYLHHLHTSHIFVSFGLISFIIIFGLLSCVELDTS